jgi:tetratricopeptide (TPR) repeat protein
MKLAMLPIVVALMVAPAAAEETTTAETGQRYRVEVATGDTEALEQARVELQKSIAVGGSAADAVADWRYDWAYLNWRIGQQLPGDEKKRRKSLLKEAEDQLDLILEYRPESAEAHALRGTVIGNRIDGGFSGALLGRRASKAHERALELAPDNPRVAMHHGVSLHFTPKTFGGGNELAIAELRRALELFEAEPAAQAWPNFGRVEALAWLGIILAEEGAKDEGRGFLERALEVEPDNAWVRQTLDGLGS